MSKPFHVVTKVQDTTHFGVGFERPIYVHHLMDGPAPAHAEYVFDSGIHSGSFWIYPAEHSEPLKVVHAEGPELQVHFQHGQMFPVPARHEIPLVVQPASLDLGFSMSIKDGAFQPEYQILLDVARNDRLSPCGLDKSAMGGPEAILAVAANRNLTAEQFVRWAQCPWVPCMREIMRNPSAPAELRKALRNAVG